MPTFYQLYLGLTEHLVRVAQNTSGDSKAKIYGRIAQSIWPGPYKENAKVTTSRTKAKAEW